MSTTEVTPTIIPARKIHTGADLWEAFNDIDQMMEDPHADIKRALVKVQNNGQRIAYIKLAFRAGAIKQTMLALPKSSE